MLQEKWKRRKSGVSHSLRVREGFLEEGAPAMKLERQMGVGFMKREDSFCTEGHRGNPGGLR